METASARSGRPGHGGQAGGGAGAEQGPLALVPGYAFAWISHFFVEKNQPATFTYPLWSFMGDWKMLAMTLTERLKR